MLASQEFMYLMPGNWFEIKNIDQDKLYPYDIESLQTEIINQINSRNEKLDFINISFGARYGNNTIDEIIFHLDNQKFSAMAKILETEKRHPIITFHGTNLDAVNSILANGYIIPQALTEKQQNGQKNDIMVRRANGAMYGIGVYTSPFYDKAIYYSRAVESKYVYVLVNMVFLGIVKLIPPLGNKNFTDFSAPKNGIYADGSNTRIVYGLEQIVSANSDMVFPIAILKIKIA